MQGRPGERFQSCPLRKLEAAKHGWCQKCFHTEVCTSHCSQLRRRLPVNSGWGRGVGRAPGWQKRAAKPTMRE